MNLRESLASTSLASLEWTEERERAVDRVAASGKASRLALSLFKAKWMVEAWAYRDALDGLISHYMARYRNEDPGVARRVSKQALDEFIAQFCTTCRGAREIEVEQLRVMCQECGGSGVRRYHDHERARAMDMSVQRVKSLNFKLDRLKSDIQEMESEVNATLRRELRELF